MLVMTLFAFFLCHAYLHVLISTCLIFCRDAFVFPNKKAMEAVFYFLFTKLNSDVAQEEFRFVHF